jgi:hypothetical protein
MSAPTVSPVSPVVTATTTATARVATVRFSDLDDAHVFLDWLAARGAKARTGVTFPIFAATAADAYGLCSSLTYATFSEMECANLPAGALDRGPEFGAPVVVGPVASDDGWEIVQILSVSSGPTR